MKPFEWFGSTIGVFDCLWLFWQVKTVWFEFMIWLKHWISFILRPHQYWLHTIYNTFFVCSFVYLAMDKVWNNISCCFIWITKTITDNAWPLCFNANLTEFKQRLNCSGIREGYGYLFSKDFSFNIFVSFFFNFLRTNCSIQTSLYL